MAEERAIDDEVREYRYSNKWGKWRRRRRVNLEITWKFICYEETFEALRILEDLLQGSFQIFHGRLFTTNNFSVAYSEANLLLKAFTGFPDIARKLHIPTSCLEAYYERKSLLEVHIYRKYTKTLQILLKSSFVAFLEHA